MYIHLYISLKLILRCVNIIDKFLTIKSFTKTYLVIIIYIHCRKLYLIDNIKLKGELYE